MDRAESAESNRNRASIFERFAGLTHDGVDEVDHYYDDADDAQFDPAFISS